jgi:hypothetical protein
MEAICFSETLLYIYKFTRRRKPGDRQARMYRRENYQVSYRIVDVCKFLL